MEPRSRSNWCHIYPSESHPKLTDRLFLSVKTMSPKNHHVVHWIKNEGRKKNIYFFIMRKHQLALLTGVNPSYESITAVSRGNDIFTKKQTVKSFVLHRCQRWRKKSVQLFCGRPCHKMLLPTDSQWKSCDHLYRRHLFSWVSWGLRDEGSKSSHDSPVDFHIPKKEKVR